jgi:uncharacterized membrane protein YuzA (DUF378 family)
MGAGIAIRNQAAAGAGRAMNTELTWSAVGLAAVANVATWLKIIYDHKQANGKNGSGGG